MTPLTDKEKQIIEDAFMLIESGEERYSCLSICSALGILYNRRWGRLTTKYCKFIFNAKPDNVLWAGLSRFEDDVNEKQARLLMLATFYVLAGEI